jgi:hypothetical protein
MVAFIDTYEIESSVIDVIAPLSTLGYASVCASSYAAAQQYINSSPFSSQSRILSTFCLRYYFWCNDSIS